MFDRFQQSENNLKRKRHIGNDGVVVVFRSFTGEPKQTIKSRVTKCFIFVDLVNEEEVKIQIFGAEMDPEYLKQSKLVYRMDDLGELFKIICNCCLAVYTNIDYLGKVQKMRQLMISQGVE